MYRHAPILTFAVNQSHIDTVAMRLLQRLTGTTYHMFRRVYVLDIYQMLTLSSQNHRMALNSFTQCYNITVTYPMTHLIPCGLVQAECLINAKSEKLQGVHIEIDESKWLCSDAHCTCTMGMWFFTL